MSFLATLNLCTASVRTDQLKTSGTSATEIRGWDLKAAKIFNKIEKKMLVAYGDITFQHRVGKQIFFALKSPLTNEWTEFQATEEELASNNPPANVAAFVEYYQDLRWIMEKARTYQPLNKDLTPLDPEEARTFGIKWPKRHYHPVPYFRGEFDD